jgi:hypothetical protein
MARCSIVVSNCWWMRGFRSSRHHDGQKLPQEEAVALVERVRSSAARNARARLDVLAAEVSKEIVDDMQIHDC